VLAPIRADVADDLGLRHDVEVVTGANDSIAAAFGSGALESGRATVMIGTTGVLIVHHPTRHVDNAKFIVTMPSALEDRYYVVAEAGLAGKLVEVAPGAKAPAGSGGVMFLPWVFGAMAPAIDPRHRGAFLGISLYTDRADLARAMIEGVCMQMRWLVDEVEQALGAPLRSVRFVGGAAASDVWAAILADVVGRPIEQLANPRHANARGAGLMAFVSTGRLRVDDVTALVPVRGCYEPSPSTATFWDDRLAVFRELHATLGEAVSRLTRHP
jgi:xylulokinase